MDTLTSVVTAALPANGRLQLLCEDDFAALQQFELDNRSWFEQYIETRGDDFYRAEGIREHISDCLEKYRQGIMYPGLLKGAEGEILGRANLHDINTETGNAYAGYRIAESVVGQGLASTALQQLIRQAFDRYRLKQITAFASVDNPASTHILKKQGFKLMETLPSLVEVNGVKLDCHKLILSNP